MEWSRIRVLRQFIIESTASFIYIAQGVLCKQIINPPFTLFIKYASLKSISGKGQDLLYSSGQVNIATRMNRVLLQIIRKQTRSAFGTRPWILPLTHGALGELKEGRKGGRDRGGRKTERERGRERKAINVYLLLPHQVQVGT